MTDTASRDLIVRLTPHAGTINYFFAFLDNKRIIGAQGNKERAWSGSISNDRVALKVRVTGIGDAQYKLHIDLPGTADDQSLTLTLTGGYHEMEITL